MLPACCTSNAAAEQTAAFLGRRLSSTRKEERSTSCKLFISACRSHFKGHNWNGNFHRKAVVNWESWVVKRLPSQSKPFLVHPSKSLSKERELSPTPPTCLSPLISALFAALYPSLWGSKEPQIHETLGLFAMPREAATASVLSQPQLPYHLALQDRCCSVDFFFLSSCFCCCWGITGLAAVLCCALLRLCCKKKNKKSQKNYGAPESPIQKHGTNGLLGAPWLWACFWLFFFPSQHKSPASV